MRELVRTWNVKDTEAPEEVVMLGRCTWIREKWIEDESDALAIARAETAELHRSKVCAPRCFRFVGKTARRVLERRGFTRFRHGGRPCDLRQSRFQYNE
jgi:hypothetical protein